MGNGKHIVIIGHFIHFKRFLKKEAFRLDVNGVLTKINGHTLDLFVTGEPEALKEFIKICKTGNTESTVYNITIKNKDFGQPFLGFEIMAHKPRNLKKPFWKKIFGF
jgi:acylphosphatase